MADYGISDEDRKRAFWEALMASGFGLLGAQRGQEGQAVGRAGLLGLGTYNQGLRDTRRDNLAAAAEKRSAQTYDMQAAQFAEQQRQWAEQRAQQAAMRAAQQGAMIPGQQAMPAMGPPTASGEVQPPVAERAPRLDLPKYANTLLTTPGLADKGIALQQAMVKESPFDKPKPEHYTPESLAAYKASGNIAALVPIAAKPEPVTGKVSPSDFTPASVAAFVANGGKDYSVLVPIDKTPRTTVNVDARQPPPKGYQWSKDQRSLEVIPGGPEDTSKKDIPRAENAVNRADIVIAKVDKAIGQVGIATAGPVGSVMSRIPGSPALDLKKTVDTIKANIGFQELQAMREASPTGGALGQVAVQELNMLQAVVSSLDTEQSPAQLRESLGAVRKHFNNWRSIMKDAAMRKPAGATGGWAIEEQR